MLLLLTLAVQEVVVMSSMGQGLEEAIVKMDQQIHYLLATIPGRHENNKDR